MKTLTRNSLIILGTTIALTGCNLTSLGEKPSVAPEKVVIKEDPNNFTHAYDKATMECKLGDKMARYIPDQSSSLEQLTFECFDPNIDEELVETSEETGEIEETISLEQSETEETTSEIQSDTESELIEETLPSEKTDIEPEMIIETVYEKETDTAEESMIDDLTDLESDEVEEPLEEESAQ